MFVLHRRHVLKKAAVLAGREHKQVTLVLRDAMAAEPALLQVP